MADPSAQKNLRRRQVNVSTPRSEVVEQKTDTSTTSRLLSYDELPVWQHDNAFILTHYRGPNNSFRVCIQSLFYLHNESVNIHTHLLGFLTALIGFPWLYIHALEHYPHVNPFDILVFTPFFAGTLVCLGASASYHCVGCHSPQVARWGNQINYVGIVALIWGSFIPSVWFGFSYDPFASAVLSSGEQWSVDEGAAWSLVWVWVYWTMITLLGGLCTTVSINTKFRTPAWRPYRTSVFVAMGLSAIFPVFHGIYLYGIPQLEKQIGLSWLVLQGLLYIVGAGLYVIRARVPERLKPAAFDLFGTSHQIFHVLILAAICSHLYGLLIAFDYKYSIQYSSIP